MKNEFPKTLIDAIKYFADPDVALRFMVGIRWPEGIVCPRCDSDKHSFVSTRSLWICKGCKKHFSVKIGTVMEDSPIGLDKWLCAIWMICGAKNGISSYEIHRAIGITQKSAWFLLHRIRVAMQTGTFTKLSGEVEVDETYIGGLARNMHKHIREEKIKGTGGSGKTIVMGMLERHGEVRTQVVPNAKRKTLRPHILENVEVGSAVFTDALRSYDGLESHYLHEVINHAEEYVRGNVHTSCIDNFWCLLKRTIKGTYVSVEPYHLFRYLDEQSFRFNNRKTNDSQRFMAAAKNISGKRLTYQELTGKLPAGYQTSH